MLAPYESPSNRLSRNMYDELTMPWDLSPPVVAFSPEQHERREWNRNGVLSEGEADFFGGSEVSTLKELGESLGTSSMVTRWRDANPTLVGTEDDCVEVTMKRIALALGADDSKMAKLKTGGATSVLAFRRAMENEVQACNLHTGIAVWSRDAIMTTRRNEILRRTSMQ
jgi:hypothetical protein